MKQKTHRLLSLLLTLVMVLSLLPTVAFAEADSRIPLEEVTGSAVAGKDYKDLAVYGNPIWDTARSLLIKFTFTNEGLSCPDSMYDWQKKNSDGTWETVTTGIFTPGIYRLRAQLRYNSSSKRLVTDTVVKIDGAIWTHNSPFGSDNDDYSFFTIFSPEINVTKPNDDLVFTESRRLDIPQSYVGRPITSYSLLDYVIGGEKPYTFTKMDQTTYTGWIDVSADGIVSGTPTKACSETYFTVKVTDAKGKYERIDIQVYKVTQNPEARSAISIVEATSDIKEELVYNRYAFGPTLTLTSGEPAVFESFPRFEKWNDATLSWESCSVFRSWQVTKGKYRVSTQVRIERYNANEYKFADDLTLKVDGVPWTVEKVNNFSSYCAAFVLSPEFTVTEPAPLTGTVALSSAYYNSPVNPNTTGLPSTGLSYKWQRSNDGTSGWANISGAASRAYTPVEADVGKYIRVVITADGYLGSAISNGIEVKQSLINFEKPVMPTLSYNSTNGLVVTNAKANQEYIVTYNSNTPSDWTSAIKPSADGSLKLTASQNTTVYVHTRVAETTYKPAGMYTDYNSIYTGTPTYLVDFSINYSKLSLKVGEVVKLTATPIPAGATAWQTTPGVQWYVNGSSAKLYKDAACTQEYNRYSDGTYESVYLKGISQSNWFTVGAERTISGYIPTNRQITVAVTDTKGNYIPERLYFQDVTLAPGESVTIDIASYPYPSKVEGTMTFEPSTGNPASKLTLTALENNTKLKIEVPADAILGGYGYSVKLDGTTINKNVWTITVAKKDIPVDGVTVIPSNITLAPGSSTTLVAVVSPSNHTATGSVVWSKVSGSASITIDPATGRVTVSASAAEGDKATMRATVGGKYGEFVVTVETAKYSVITLNGAAYVGEGTLIEAAEEGTRINLRADPAPAGKVFDKWVCTAGGAYLDNAYSQETYFIMPGGAVIIEATYTEKAKYGVITLNGAAYVGEGTLIEAAEEGTRINLRADPAPAGKVFDKWVCTAGGAYLDNAYSQETYFIMPGGAVIIEATYKGAAAAVTDITSADITVTAPVSGGKPAGAATADVKFTVANTAWEPAADKFAPNTVYSVVVMLEAGEGYRFTASTVFRLNGSAATVVTQSADEAKISFTFPATVSAEHVHSLTHVPATPATCTAAGNKAYYICAGCGRLFEDAAGTVETTADKVVEKATGHSYEWVTDKEPTATESGLRHEECRVCGDKKAAVEIPAAGTATDTTPQTTPATTPATTPTTEVTGGTEAGAATGTENVPDDTQPAPPTGKKSFMWLWAVLIVVLGACAAGAAVYFSKKKKHPAK